MAIFNINVNSKVFRVEQLSVIVTDCSTIVSYEIFANNDDVIAITMSGTYKNANYTSNNNSNFFSSDVLIAFNNTLKITFAIENGGSAGIYKTASISINNNTTGELFQESHTREDDSPICVNENAADYDTLNDTPNTKVGSAGKFIRVSDDEQTHEYVSIEQDEVLQTFNSAQLAFDILGPNKLFRWSEANYDGIPSINGTQVGKTKSSN